MLVQTTLDTLNRLKLYAMAAALAEQLNNSAAARLSFEERLGLLVDREVLHRDNRRLTRLLQLAQLKHRNACIEDVDYRASRHLDRAQIASLASCDWIRQAHNLLIHGATGAGKTWLACAFAQQACRQGLSALYIRAPRLFDELSVCHADGSFRKRLTAIAKVNVLVIDDFAIAPMGARERTDLLEILDDRVGTRATVVTVSSIPTTGTTTSASPRSLTPSSIGSCTARTRSISKQRSRCAKAAHAASRHGNMKSNREHPPQTWSDETRYREYAAP